MVVTRQLEAQLEMLRLSGRLDASSVAAVRSEINDVIDAHPTGDLVIDVSGVDVVDATGLGVLTAAHVRLEREGRMLVLRGCSAPMHRVLAMTRLLRVLHVEPVARPA